MNTEMTTQEMDMMDEIDEVVAQCTWFVEHGCMTIEKALEKVATSQITGWMKSQWQQ